MKALLISTITGILALTAVQLMSDKKEPLKVPPFLRDHGLSKVVRPSADLREYRNMDALGSRPPFLENSYVAFKEALGFRESSGDYFTVNKLGYLGKYQFGPGTLQVIGLFNTREFLNDPRLQEKAFHANIARNKWLLRKDLQWFAGKTVGGVPVTESGILAAAHLAGAGNVKEFLRSNGKDSFEDAFGTSIREYFIKFQGYDVSPITAHRNPRVPLG